MILRLASPLKFPVTIFFPCFFCVFQCFGLHPKKNGKSSPPPSLPVVAEPSPRLGQHEKLVQSSGKSGETKGMTQGKFWKINFPFQRGKLQVHHVRSRK